MLKIAYRHASVVLVIFHHYMKDERCCVMILSYLLNAMKKMLGKNLFDTS